MNHIQCPQERPLTYGLGYPYPTRVFLAGGITNCPDWQSQALPHLEPFTLEVYNPRRIDFDRSDISMTHFQIEWEYRHLHAAQVILFWFPKETLCPITLYELGKWASRKPCIVGCHEDYARLLDVHKQLELDVPEITVQVGFHNWISEVHNYFEKEESKRED